uniref:Uncharacterized protein n=1 Tax=Romanomermis culicivorax TaxID=13658 RepID=A0A915L6F7_ROMCU
MNAPENDKEGRSSVAEHCLKGSDDNNNILHRVRVVRSPISEIVPALDLLEKEIIKRPQLKEYTNPKGLTLSPESAATTEPMAITTAPSTMARPSTVTPPFTMNPLLTVTPRPMRTPSSTMMPTLTTTPTSTMARPLTVTLPLSTTLALTMAPSYTLAMTPILMWSPTSTITGPSTVTPSSSTTLASTATPSNSNDIASLNKCLKEEKTMDCNTTCRKVCYITKESCAKKQTPTLKLSKMPKNVPIWSEITTTSNEMLIRDWLSSNFTDKKTKGITNSMPSVIEPDAMIASEMLRSGTMEQHMCERDADCSQLREPVAYCNWNSWARPYKFPFWIGLRRNESNLTIAYWKDECRNPMYRSGLFSLRDIIGYNKSYSLDVDGYESYDASTTLPYFLCRKTAPASAISTIRVRTWQVHYLMTTMQPATNATT